MMSQPSRLSELPVRALHRLDASNSRLRHSIVEACFYNLRVLSQELPGRADGRELRQNLEESLGNVHRARDLMERHFGYRVTPEWNVADLFPQKYRHTVRALERIETLADEGLPSQDDAKARKKFSESMVGAVDEVLAQIDALKEEIVGLKVPLGELLEDLVAIERDACRGQGIDLKLKDETGERVAVFARREGLLNALGELIRNAVRYAFPDESDENRRITVGLSRDKKTRDAVVSICDNGRGMTGDHLKLVGTAGASTSGGGDGISMVRRIVEGEHLGVVRFESDLGEGTCVRVRLPRRAEPGLRLPEGSETAWNVRGSWRRVRSVAILLLLALAVGIGLSWYALTGGRGKSSVIRVAPDGTGEHASLKEAVERAKPGATIRVAPGEYSGSIVLEKPLRIVGDPDQKPVIRSRHGPVLLSTATGAVVENIGLILETQIKSAAIYVEGGDLRLENCEVSSRGLAAIEVARGEPTVLHTAIGPSRRSGIFVYGGAGGTYENLDISSCGGSGIAVSEEADPLVRDVRISRCEKGGVNVYSGGRGTFERVEAIECGVAGFITSTEADPIIRHSSAHDGPADGILVASGGRGTIRRNDVYGNAGNGIVLSEGSRATVRQNRIHGNEARQLWIQDGAKGTVQDNTTGDEAR